MEKLKDYIAEQLVGKKLHFKCECIFPFDEIGPIKDWELNNNEIIFLVDVRGKIIRIGENHPNMLVE